MTIDVKIKGLDKFKRGLKSLPKEVALKVLRKALKEGGEHLRDAMKARTPNKTGALRDSIQARLKKINDYEYRSIVSPFLTGGPNPVWYAHLVEYGGRYVIKARGNKKRIVATGRIGAQPFMRPTFDVEKGRLIQSISDALGRGVAREFKRLNKNG